MTLVSHGQQSPSLAFAMDIEFFPSRCLSCKDLKSLELLGTVLLENK